MPHRLRVGDVLLPQDARGQRVLGVVVEHRHGALHDDGARVEFLGDQVHGHAAHLAPCVERLALGVEAGKRRQQRRVDVQDRVGERVEQRLARPPHEAGQAHQDYTCVRNSATSARSKSSRDGQPR